MNQLRVELYKLYYYDSLFDLNIKGDSAELYNAILKLIHGCFIDSVARKTIGSLEDELDQRCRMERCFVHQCCFISLILNVSCKCGQRKTVQDYYYNNFTHVINGT